MHYVTLECNCRREEENQPDSDVDAEDQPRPGRPKLSKQSFVIHAEDIYDHRTDPVFPKLKDYEAYIRDIFSECQDQPNRLQGSVATLKVWGTQKERELVVEVLKLTVDSVQKSIKKFVAMVERRHEVACDDSYSDLLTPESISETKRMVEAEKAANEADPPYKPEKQKRDAMIVRCLGTMQMSVRDTAAKARTSVATVSRTWSRFKSNPSMFFEQLRKRKPSIFGDVAFARRMIRKRLERENDLLTNECRLVSFLRGLFPELAKVPDHRLLECAKDELAFRKVMPKKIYAVKETPIELSEDSFTIVLYL